MLRCPEVLLNGIQQKFRAPGKFAESIRKISGAYLNLLLTARVKKTISFTTCPLSVISAEYDFFPDVPVKVKFLVCTGSNFALLF
jgi:hypothetical protein